jgi:hypothetical protein
MSRALVDGDQHDRKTVEERVPGGSGVPSVRVSLGILTPCCLAPEISLRSTVR